MSDDRQKVADNATAFFQKAVNAGLDFRMGVTDMHDGMNGLFATRALGTSTGDRWLAPNELAALQRDLRTALSVFRRYARVFAMGRPRCRTLHARSAALEGAGARARRNIEQALEAADELGMSYEKGLALLSAARSPVLDRETRARRAEQASRVLGAGRALRAARSLQEDLAKESR